MGRPLYPDLPVNATAEDLGKMLAIPTVNLNVRTKWIGDIEGQSRVYHLELGQAVVFKLRNKDTFLRGYVTDLTFGRIEINGDKYQQSEVVQLYEIPGEKRPSTNEWREAFLRERKDFLKQVEREQEVWTELESNIDTELAVLRALSPQDRGAAMRARGADAIAKIKAHFGVSEIAFHYNRGGSRASEFVEHDGLVLTHSSDREPRDVVWCHKRVDNLFEELNESYEGSRMGRVLVIFSPSSPYFQNGFKKGVIQNPLINYFEFDKNWIMQQPFGQMRFVAGFGGDPTYTAIPSTEFLVPPLNVFPHHLYDKLKRNWAEESYINMLYVEHMMLTSKPN